MASEADNQELPTETIIHKTSNVAEPDKHLETVLKHYEAENVKEPIEGDRIGKLPSIGKASSEKLLSLSSEPNLAVEICDKPGVSESLDGEETKDIVSKSLVVKETEGQLPKSSDGKETEGHLVEKGELNSSQGIQVMTEETVGEGYRNRNGRADQEAEGHNSELKEENEAEDLSNASFTLDSTEKTTSSEPVTFEDHISRTPPQEGSLHTISSGTNEKELHMASASEDLHSNLEDMESRGDMKEEIQNNEKSGSDAPESVTLKSDHLDVLNKEESEKGEEMKAYPGTASAVAPIEETCEVGIRSEAVLSSSDIKETVSMVGQSERVEEGQKQEISLPEAPWEARKDDNASSTKEKQPIDEKNAPTVDLNEEDEIHLYDAAKGQQDLPVLVHETETSKGTQLAVEEPKVSHNTNEGERKLDSSDLGMSLTEGASGIDLAPPCQIDAGNLETESILVANDLNEKDEIHLYDKAKGQDAPPLVHETEASKETQLSVEEPKVMHNIDESDRKQDSSDLGVTLTEGAANLDLAPPCQINSDSLTTEARLVENYLNKEDEIHLYDTAKSQQDAPPLVHGTEASEVTQLRVEAPKVTHKTNESDSKLDNSDLGMPLTEGASGIDLPPPSQVDADNLETESRLIENDLNEEVEIHLFDKINGQQDFRSLVHETEASEGTQLSIEERKGTHKEAPDMDLAPPCQNQIDTENRETESRLIENYPNKEDEIHSYDTAKGQQDAPPLVHETKGSEGTQLSAEEPNVMHHIDEADRKLDSSVFGLSLTEGAPGMDLATPCLKDADNFEDGLTMDARKELEITETNTEEELEQVPNSLVESHNLSIANDASIKVTKEETEFDSSNTSLSEEKRDAQQSEPSEAPQKSEATDQRDEKQNVMNDNINQNSKPEEHRETDTIANEAEEINSPISDKEHDTLSYSPILTTEESKVFDRTTSIAEPDEHSDSLLKLYEGEPIKASNTECTDSGNIDEFPSVDKALSGAENGTEQISESLEGKEIQDQVLENLDRKETEGHASEISDEKVTEGCGSKSSDGKETQDYHVEKGECNSTREIQTNTEEIIYEGYQGTNGGIAKEVTDVDIPADNSHQREEVEVSELTGETKIKNMTKTTMLDNTEKITSVSFEDQLSKPSIEEDSSDTISSSITKKELYVRTGSEDIIPNVEDIESRAIEEEIINNDKIGIDAPVNVVLKSDHLGSPLGAPAVTPIEETCFLDIKGITSLDEQSETDEKARNTKINLPDVPTEARKDETIIASGSQETQPFDEKEQSISADDLKEEDGTNQYDTAKGQPNAPSLIYETEIREENQISAEEPEEMHNLNEVNPVAHSSNLGLTPIEGASDMDMIPQCQIDDDKAAPEIYSSQELHINAESNTNDKLQQNDAGSETIKEEKHVHSSGTMITEPTEDLGDGKGSQMEGKSEAAEDLGDGKEEKTNDIYPDSELQGHEETYISNKENEEITNITDKEQIIQIYPETLTTEESKKTNEKAASECENTKVNSKNKEDGNEDELSVSVKEKDLLDSLENPEQVIKTSIEEDKNSADEDKLDNSNGEGEGKEENVVISQTSKTDESCEQMPSISEADVKEHGDKTYLAEQASRTDASCEELPLISGKDTKEHGDSNNLETHDTNGSFNRTEDQEINSDEHQIDETPCENVEVMHEHFTKESSQMPEHIEKHDHINQTPEDIEEKGTLNELHSVSEVDIPSHEAKDIDLTSLNSIDTIDSSDKAEEIPVLLAETSKTDEDASIIVTPEEMKEEKEQVQGMKSTSLQNVEKKDSDEKIEGGVLRVAENSNTEQDSSITEVAQKTTGDNKHVQYMSNMMSLHNIDTMDSDEKPEGGVLELAENFNTEQESSTSVVPKDTKGDKMHIQGITNMILEKSEEASADNLMKETGDCNETTDALMKRESSLEDVQNDEKTFHVYSTGMDNKNPLRINNSCEKVEEVEIEQLERTSGAVYQTEPSDEKETISARIKMETPTEQKDNIDEGQQNHEGREEISGTIHGNDDDIEDGHTTSIQTQREATNELQETCGVQHREEQELEPPESIKGTIHEGEIAVGVSSMTSSEEECLLKNDSDAPELRIPSGEGMRDLSRMEEENVYKEKSEDTGAEMSSPDPNCMTSEISQKDADNLYMSDVTVMIDKFEESQEATESKLDMSSRVLESDGELHNTEVPSETKKGEIKEGAIQAEVGADNSPKEEMTETGSIEDNISREKVKGEVPNGLEREATPEEPQSIPIEDNISREVKDEGLSALEGDSIPEESQSITIEDDKSRAKDKDVVPSGLEREAIPEEPQSITIEEMPETTNNKNNSEKVSIGDMDSIQSEKDRGDGEYEKSFESNSEGEKKPTTGDFPVTDIPGSNKVGANPELLAEGHKPAEGSSLETSEEISKIIIDDETNESNEDQVIFAESTSDVKLNEVTEQHGITEGGDHSKIQDPSLEEEVRIPDKHLPPLAEVSITNVLKDIEMIPESVKTTAKAETQKQQIADASNAVPEATNLASELQCSGDESKEIEQESTTMRPVNDPTLDLTQGPKDSNHSDASKGESLAQLSDVHDDHVIKDVAEEEDPLENESRNNEEIENKNSSNLPVSSDKDSEETDPGESKPMMSSEDKDIHLLESRSTTVTDLEEIKHVYPSEAVPEPHTTGSAGKRASYDHKETPDSTIAVADHGQEFAEEDTHEPGDTDSQDPHEDNHVLQHVQESSMGSQEGSIDVESTHQTAELTLASEPLSTPEADGLIVSSPKDCKDVSQMQEKIAAGGNRITDEPEETTEKHLPAETSEESTWEDADEPGETNKLKTRPTGGEVKPDNAEVEKEEHSEQKEGELGYEVVFIGEKDPDENVKIEKEACSEQKEFNSGSEVVFIGEKDLDEDTKVEKEESAEQKEGNSGSEVVFIGDKDHDEDVRVEKEEYGEQKEGNSDVVSIGEKYLDENAKVEKVEHGEQNDGNSGSEVVIIGEKDPDEDANVEKKHGEHNECNSGSEVVLIGEKDPDEDAKVEKEEHGGQKEGNSRSEVVFIDENDPDEDSKVDKEENGQQKEGNTGSEVVLIGQKDTDDESKVKQVEHGQQREGNSGSDVIFISEKDPDEEAMFEKEEHGEPKEGDSESEVGFTGQRDLDDNTKKIIAAEVKAISPTVVSNDMILEHVDREQGTETLINKESTKLKACEATVEEKEDDVQKENKRGSEEPINGEKDPDYDNSSKIIAAEMDCSSNMAMSERTLQGHSEDHMEADKEVKTDESKVEREELDVGKGKEPVSEALSTSEKEVDDPIVDLSIVAQMTDGASSAMPDDRTLVQECPEDHREKKNYSEDKETNTDPDETVKEQDIWKEGNPEAEVPLTGEKDNDHHTSNRIPITEMRERSIGAKPDYETVVQEYPGAGTKAVVFSSDKEVKADGAEAAIVDQDGLKEEKLDSEVAVMSEKDRVDDGVSVKEDSEDLKAAVTQREDKGIKADSKSGVTDGDLENLIPVNTSGAVAESERSESAEQKIPSQGCQKMQEALKSTLSPKISQTNQEKDSAEEIKPNAVTIESPTPENFHALPHITGLPTETIMEADDRDNDISRTNQEKKEIPPLEAEKYMVVEADLKVTQEPEDAKNILPPLQKEAAETFQADEKNSGSGEQSFEPANNNEKITTNETKEGNNLPSEKETPVVEQIAHLSEAKKEEVDAKNTGRNEDIKEEKSSEHKDKEHEEGKEHQEENTDSDLRVMIETSKDTEVKVSPKKSHNLLSGVIKHSISKMKKAITCTNSQPMPQSPR